MMGPPSRKDSPIITVTVIGTATTNVHGTVIEAVNRPEQHKRQVAANSTPYHAMLSTT